MKLSILSLRENSLIDDEVHDVAITIVSSSMRSMEKTQ